MKQIERIYPYLFAIFCFVIPFEHSARALPNILLLLLVVFFPYQNLKKSIKRFKKELIYSFLLIGIITINTLLFQRWEDFDIIFRLLYIPLIIILFSPIKNPKYSLNAFVFGVFLLCCLSAFLITINMIKDSSFALANGEKVNELLFGHRPYLGFMYLIAAYFSFFLATESSDKIKRILYTIVGVFFVGFIFFIAARLSTLAVFVSLLIAAVYYVKKIKISTKWLVLGSALFFTLFFSLSSNLSKRFYIHDENINFIQAEPRYYIWDCVYETKPVNFKQILFGKGYEKTQNDLVICYQHKENFLDSEHQQWFIDSRFNTHNQFLDFFLSQGILVGLLSIIYFVNLMAFTRKDFFSFGLIIAVLLFFLVENVLTRQIGSILTALVISFVVRKTKFS